MAKFSFSDIEAAFLYVSSQRYGMNSAFLCKDSGKIIYHSELLGDDDLEDEEEIDWDQRVEVPHMNDLGLGRNLVFEFVEEHLPEDYGRVEEMFRKSGAYARYKDLLERRGLIQKWDDLENSRERTAIREWCEENEIEIGE